MSDVSAIKTFVFLTLARVFGLFSHARIQHNHVCNAKAQANKRRTSTDCAAVKSLVLETHAFVRHRRSTPRRIHQICNFREKVEMLAPREAKHDANTTGNLNKNVFRSACDVTRSVCSKERNLEGQLTSQCQNFNASFASSSLAVDHFFCRKPF